MKLAKTSIVFAALLLLMASCGGSSAGNTGEETAPETITRGLTFTTAADFSSSAIASISKSLAKTVSGQCDLLETPEGAEHPAMDDPRIADGLDCDEDLRLVRHVTPSQYSIAFKKVALVASVGSDIDLVADTSTLADSEVINFTANDSSESIISIDASDLATGTYTSVMSEIYYFQIKFPVGGVETNVRIYMSDDDFESEGMLGHHQGDVTFVDDAGHELGWIDWTWLAENLVQTRPSTMGGAATPDPETGHDRGFFGDDNLWNEGTFMQGAAQDIYYYALYFDEPLEIPDPSEITGVTTVTATFSIADTFYYEDGSPYSDSADFPGFYPNEGGEANDVNAEWAPQAPTATITVTSE